MLGSKITLNNYLKLNEYLKSDFFFNKTNCLVNYLVEVFSDKF